MKYFITVLLIITTLLGCASIKSIHETISSVSEGNIVNEIKSVELTSSEVSIMTHSVNNLRNFIDKWSHISGEDNLQEFLSDYSEVKANYLSLHKIIKDNWDKYPTELRNKFIEYKKDATKLDKTIDRLVLAQKLYKASREAVTLAKIAIGMLK